MRFPGVGGVWAAVILGACATDGPPFPSQAPTHPGGPGQDRLAGPAVADLADFLEPVREENGLPALAALVLRDGQVVAEGAVGTRRVAGETPVTTGDLWHLGSCTKSMTATMLARLVARGDLSWDTTVGEVFGDLELHDAWRPVTLAQLLTNSSGAPQDLSFDGLWNRLWEREGTPTEQRLVLVEAVLTREPFAPPGTRFVYSNAAFSIAGAMAEAVVGVSYEQLMQREVFDPLGMETAAWGAPGSAGLDDQPLGHFWRREELNVRELGLGDDTPRGHRARRVGPYLAARLGALRRPSPRGGPRAAEAGAETDLDFERMHRPVFDDYAMGWMVTQPEWAEGRLLWHNGSNTFWYCEAALYPASDLAILVATNTEHGRTRQAVWGLARQLYDAYGPQPSGQGDSEGL